MVRIILTALALLAVSTVGAANTAPRAITQSELIELERAKQYDRYEAFMNACEYTTYVCEITIVPRVEYKDMRPGLLGYYDGGSTIYIRRGLRGWQRKEVLMHETVHYLQKQLGGLVVPGPAKEICFAEDETFKAVDRWLIDSGKRYMIVGPNWWKPYKHCYKWFNPDYPKASIMQRIIWDIL